MSVLTAIQFFRFYFKFLNISNMKKGLIPVFLLIGTLFAFGCAKKTDNGAADTTIPAPSETSKKGSAASPTEATSVIAPPGNGNPINPINVTVETHAVTFAGTMNGPAMQTVTFNGIDCPPPFSGNNGYTWTYTSAAPRSTPISVVATIADGQYASSPSTPMDTGKNKTGYDQTTYSDASGANQSIITIQENGIAKSAEGKK
jgi:hypothetical protein